MNQISLTFLKFPCGDRIVCTTPLHLFVLNAAAVVSPKSSAIVFSSSVSCAAAILSNPDWYCCMKSCRPHLPGLPLGRVIAPLSLMIFRASRSSRLVRASRLSRKSGVPSRIFSVPASCAGFKTPAKTHSSRPQKPRGESQPTRPRGLVTS